MLRFVLSDVEHLQHRHNREKEKTGQHELRGQSTTASRQQLREGGKPRWSRVLGRYLARLLMDLLPPSSTCGAGASPSS